MQTMDVVSQSSLPRRLESVKTRAHVIVTGKVQGVFYRAETASKAKQLNLTGWIRNLPDGRVEAIFEGEEINVKKIVDFCRRGPPNAYVVDVDVRRQEWKGEFDDFEVRYYD
jgi:acylphosphatase